MEHQPVNVVDEIGEGNLRLGASDTDGADEEPHLVLLTANTCSMRARTADLTALARAVRTGIGLPLSFLRWMRLTQPAIDALFAAFDGQLRERGYLAMGGQIVDATLVAAPKQRNNPAEKEAIKEGK